MLLLLASLSCIIQHSFGYNLETELPVIRQGDLGSYFGFSVASHSFRGIDQKNHSWLLVGAPKANNSAVPQIPSPGVVYRCDFSSESECFEVPFDTDGNTNGDIKDNSWFGVSVMSAGYNGLVMACTHRLLHVEGSFYTYPGRCIGTGRLERITRRIRFETCETENQKKANQGGPNTINYKDHKYCQMGVSASFLKDGNVPLAGAPGAYNFQGMFIYLSRSKEEVTRNNSEHGYQGYSLTHGSFFKKDKTDVASGAPRFNHHGMVVVFKSLGQGNFQTGNPTVLFPPSSEEDVQKRRQPGTGFGLALCAVDLNNDGLSELLVGAPFFSDGLHPEQGKVYLYKNKGDGNLAYSLDLSVKKEKWRANFGRALASVGDLDLDGYQDVAIGAPYEDDGEGVVYIYRGSRLGIVETPMQVVKGSSVSPGIKSFGYSLSGTLDMDFNGYPDVLVGAYQSDTVILLRSKPVISLSSTITVKPDTFDIKGRKTCNETTLEGNRFATLCFSILVCTNYTERSGNVTDKVDVLLLMKSDIGYNEKPIKRVLFSSNKKDEVNRTEGIFSNKNTCFTWNAYLREGVTDADVYPDIKFKLTYQIVEKTLPTPSSPTELPSLVQYSVLDPLKPQEATALLTFKRDCIKCVPDLVLDDSRSKRTLAVSAEIYKLEVTVKNKGDDAYNAKLYVTIPKGVKIGRIFTVRNVDGEDVVKGKLDVVSTKLDSNDTMLTMKLNTPLKKKEQSIQIELNTLRYADTPDFLPIYLSTNSTNEEEKGTLADNYRFLNISIKSQADLEVNGTTVEEQVSYGGKVVGESAMVHTSDIGNQVKHKYFVKNRGPDPVPSTEIVIQWPFEAPSGKHLLYLIDVQFDDKRINCDFKPGQLNMLGLETSSTVGSSEQQQNDTSDNATVKKRRRREADEEQEESSSKVKREAEPSKPEKLQTELDCKLGSAKCTNIRCNIKFLRAGDDVTFTIVSRLWNGTMIEDYEGQLLRVISRATVRSLNTYVQETNKDNNKAQVGTQLNPDVDVAVPSKGLPKWVIPVCVVGAVLLLVLIVFCLYKLGFFKRQKYDKNITNPEEAEGMLDNGKGYHV